MTHLIGRWAHLYTFIAQVVIVVLMIILSYLPRGGTHTPIILVLAGIAAVLAVLYPMRIREQRGANRIIITIFMVLLTILIMLTALDVGTRYITERPPITG